MTDRLSCCVPFCRRTCKRAGFPEWICGVHWPMVSKRTKARQRVARKVLARRYKRADATAMRCHGYVTAAQMDAIAAARRLCAALWERCKREAIEAAAGIT